MEQAERDQKILQEFPGYVVRKDLSKLVKGNALVPVYVLEYLLGQFCATDDPDVIEKGVEQVQKVLRDHFVVRNEAALVRSRIKERGDFRVIDRITADLNDKTDQYEANFMNLGLKAVPLDGEYIRRHPKLLVGGVWSIIDVQYQYQEDPRLGPWSVESLKPIQVSSFDFETYRAGRARFSMEEWMDVLIQSMGFNPSFFGEREKLLLLTRLIPYCENNYNFIELGPKGTGKSHIFSEFSPHGILISGGEVTLAKLFVNNSTGKLGLVGYWDIIAFDEFAGKQKRVDKSLVDVMKNYLANKTFSRGMETQSAGASFAFVGNTRRSVAYMLKHTDLLDELPEGYHDSAFIDRLHFFLPGWEVSVLRNELLTDSYGFIVDYLAETLKYLRTIDFSEDYRRFFSLNHQLSSRDRTAIEKTTSGLLKILFPDHDATPEQVEKLLRFAIEGRKRVYNQLIRIDETFEERCFSYVSTNGGEEQIVSTLEEHTYPQLTLRERAITHDEIAEDEAPEVNLEGAPVQRDPLGRPTGERMSHRGTQMIEPGTQRVVSENESGISYYDLFAPCLWSAQEIEIIDPYIRTFHQVKNLHEFLEMVMALQEIGNEVHVTLRTRRADEYEAQQESLLTQVHEAFIGTAVDFTFTISDDRSMHARSISTDDGWKISLDRGLDIFQPFDRRDAFNLQNTVQRARRCRGFEVSYHRQSR